MSEGASTVNTETSSVSTGSIRRSSRAGSNSARKPKKSQIPYGIATFSLIALFGIYLTTRSASLGFFWITGIAFGFILQKSRFCFTASMRDPFLTGITSVTRAVMIALAITTIGFTAIKYGAYINGLPIPGQSYIVPISFATVFGGVVFGIGMVIAGGCASGTLMRVGEGFQMQILSLLFFVVGSLIGAHDFGWWKAKFIMKGPSVFLPDVFGWAGALILQLLVIGFIYVAADKWENRSGAEDSH